MKTFTDCNVTDWENTCIFSLIKMLYWMCKKSKGLPLTWPQMKHAIMRNFGGLKSDEWDPFEVFKEKLNLPEEDINPEEFDEEVNVHYNTFTVAYS